MFKKNIKIIVTLGPSTKTISDLRKIKDRGVSFVRINMSHSSIDDLKYFINLAKTVDIPFIIDTEGSQIRTGDLIESSINLNENDEIKIYKEQIVGDIHKISIKPSYVIDQLKIGDILYVDFNALILEISDISTISVGYITAKAINKGSLGRNKGVAIDSSDNTKFDLPVLSEKDYQSIKVGLEEGISHIAASFMRSEQFVKDVKMATKGKMKIISKIECLDALNNLDEIIKESDFLLIDRGDLSKEIPIEKIPFLQKIILSKSRNYNKETFIATNLLETMVEKSNPTRAEVNDVINAILDGASGLTLSSETAIGKYPIACINMLNKLIKQTTLFNDITYQKSGDRLAKKLFKSNYFLSTDSSSSLISPHGGTLINRISDGSFSKQYLDSLKKIVVSQNISMDIEQIAVGTFSPLEGFMIKRDFNSVLNKMRLVNGAVWTIPIVLDVSKEHADNISLGEDIMLIGDGGLIALINVEDKYSFNKKEVSLKLYGTTSNKHPGVLWVNSLDQILLGGKITLLKRRESEFQEYILTPRQTRRLFEEKNWSRVVGFHTRNVIHRSHEFIQMKALEVENCDGLFVHPVIGKKKPGDFYAKYIIESYKLMVKNFYPADKVFFATLPTYSRYAGPREAVFTALCRKNFGCSHFIVGRDHTGVGNFYNPTASHDIFDKFPDLGMKIIKFNKIFYSKKYDGYIHETEDSDHLEEDKLHISGTEARKMFEEGDIPPCWFMRPEISQFISNAICNKEEVFIKKESVEKGIVLWFTGLSGSGKTTIAGELENRLKTLRKKVVIIDGDTVRSTINKNLGFSREDIKENNLIIAKLAEEAAFKNDFVVVPIISPYQEDRNMARSLIGSRFFEIFINCSIDKCIKRDPKGFYKKALEGKINNFIGLSKSNPYEIPINPDLEIKTDIHSLDENILLILDFLKSKALL